MQLLAFLFLYLLLGLGCAAVARMHSHRHVFELLALAVLWPLYAPFVLSHRDSSEAPVPAVSNEIALLETRSTQVTRRLAEIDELLATTDWDRASVQARESKLSNEDGHSELRKSLRVRLEHIERLHFLRNLHADELEAARALLHQRKAQLLLSRFIDPEDQEASARLRHLRERVLQAEDALVSETELLSLCRES